jgi:hypothetical protein
VRLAGPPGRQVAVLRQLGEVGADPLASLLALLAVAAERLATYLPAEPPGRDHSTSGRLGTVQVHTIDQPASARAIRAPAWVLLCPASMALYLCTGFSPPPDP